MRNAAKHLAGLKPSCEMPRSKSAPNKDQSSAVARAVYTPKSRWLFSKSVRETGRRDNAGTVNRSC